MSDITNASFVSTLVTYLGLKLHQGKYFYTANGLYKLIEKNLGIACFFAWAGMRTRDLLVHSHLFYLTILDLKLPPVHQVYY